MTSVITAITGTLTGMDYWKLTTLLLASFAAYVAYAQYRLGREKFKLDLFEKRFGVFAGARLLLTHILRDGQLNDLKYVWEYRAAIGEAKFLFNEDITDYLEGIHKRAVELYTTRSTFEPLPVGEKRSRLIEAHSEQLKWLIDQLPELTVRFSPYMKFETWR